MRPFMTDLQADEADTAAVGPPRRIDGQRASLGLGKKDGSELGEVHDVGAAPAENADVGATGRS